MFSVQCCCVLQLRATVHEFYWRPSSTELRKQKAGGLEEFEQNKNKLETWPEKRGVQKLHNQQKNPKSAEITFISPEIFLI